ncbi:hypothetical protein DL98DRAFT_617269 [Cadophora sp. DSE1049]|nr:hypothetical protein DL98DRAFT_617269 [Cadophora sp. DSE1049]
MTASRPTTLAREEAEMRDAAEILVNMANTPVDASGLRITLNDITAASNSSTATSTPPTSAAPTIPDALNGNSPNGTSPTSNSVSAPALVVPLAAPAPLNGTPAVSNSIPTYPTTATLPASATLNGTLAAPSSIPALLSAATPAAAVAVPTTAQPAPNSTVVARQSAIHDGTFRNLIVEDLSHSARPLPPISWGPTSQKYGREPQQHASVSFGGKVTDGSMKASSQPSKSVIHNTTEVRDFADFGVKPPTPADHSAHFDKIRSHYAKDLGVQQSGSGGIAFSVVNGRPRLDPVTLTKDKAGKIQTTPGSANGRVNSGQTGRNGVPKIQTPFNSQRPVTQTSFNPFSGPSPGQSMPFWFPANVAPRMSTSPYGPHTVAPFCTPSKPNHSRAAPGSGSSRTPLPSTPSKTASAPSNGVKPRNPLPFGPLKQASLPPSGGAPRTPLPVRSSSESAAANNLQQSEEYERMEHRLGDIKFGGSAVTLDDLVRLEHLERALLSDFYVLHGIFLPHPRHPNQPNEAAFVAGGFRTPSSFYNFEDRMKDLKKKVEKRLEKQAAELPDRQRDWSEQLKEEHDTLSTMYDELLHCKKCLTEFRKYLERENKVGEFYEYKLKVQYTEIGNQVIPSGYRKSTATKKKKATPTTYAKTTNVKKRRTVISIDSEDNSAEQGSTPSVTQHPRKKAKTHPTQGAQMSSTTQFRPLGQDMTGSTMHQQPRASNFQSMNGSAMHHQPRGLVQTMNGSGMHRQPHSGPTFPGMSASGTQQPLRGTAPAPRTPADVDRDISLKLAEVERLQEEIFELRWEKKVLVKGGDAGRA